jgi:hypothetical protein
VTQTLRHDEAKLSGKAVCIEREALLSGARLLVLLAVGAAIL